MIVLNELLTKSFESYLKDYVFAVRTFKTFGQILFCLNWNEKINSFSLCSRVVERRLGQVQEVWHWLCGSWWLDLLIIQYLNFANAVYNIMRSKGLRYLYKHVQLEMSLALQNAQLQKQSTCELLQGFIFVCDWILAFLLTHPKLSVPVFAVDIFFWPPYWGGRNLPASCPQSQETSLPSLQQHFYPFAGFASRQLFVKFPPGVLRIRLHLGMLAL